MRKKLAVLAVTAGLCVFSSITAFASGWQKDNTGWWWQESNGSYPKSTWKEIGGKQYYFGADGYMLTNTTTPDGYTVNADGAWTVNGVVQERNNQTNVNLTNTQATVDKSCLKFPLEHREAVTQQVVTSHENVGIERYLGIYEIRMDQWHKEFYCLDAPREIAILTDGTFHTMDKWTHVNDPFDWFDGSTRTSLTTWKKLDSANHERTATIENDGAVIHYTGYDNSTQKIEDRYYDRISQ